MATTTFQKWLIGCGIGCAAMIALVIGLVATGVYFVRSRFQPLQQASDSRKEIVAAYGEADAFVPPANGVISPDRLELFLAARAALKDAQTRLDAGLANLDFDRLNQKHPSFSSVLRTLNDLSNVILPIGEYVSRRNKILLDNHMGLGEYAYVYAISYYSLLGHSPEEGPPILEKLRLQERGRISSNDNELSQENIRRQYRRLILKLLRNQLDSIKDARQSAWRATLGEELHRVENDPGRLAWEDNLPPAIEESLKPYKRRLEETYHPSSNCLEYLTIGDFNQLQRNEPAAGRDSSTGSKAGREPVEAPGPPGKSGATAGKKDPKLP